MRSLILLACCAVLSTGASAQATRADTTDPYIWLEEMHGARAMAWVNAENAKTMAVLEKDPRWEGIYQAALAMAQAKDRLPYVSYIGGELYKPGMAAEEIHKRAVELVQAEKAARGGR